MVARRRERLTKSPKAKSAPVKDVLAGFLAEDGQAVAHRFDARVGARTHAVSF